MGNGPCTSERVDDPLGVWRTCKLSISIEVIGRSAGDMIREAMNGLVVSWPNGVGGFRGTQSSGVRVGDQPKYVI